MLLRSRKAQAYPLVFRALLQVSRAQELGADRRRESFILGLGNPAVRSVEILVFLVIDIIVAGFDHLQDPPVEVLLGGRNRQREDLGQLV